MKWVGHPENDPVLSLLDESGAAILGQLVRDAAAGWVAHDYVAGGGAGKTLYGPFASLDAAQAAVMNSVETSLNGRSTVK